MENQGQYGRNFSPYADWDITTVPVSSFNAVQLGLDSLPLFPSEDSGTVIYGTYCPTPERCQPLIKPQRDRLGKIVNINLGGGLFKDLETPYSPPQDVRELP